MKTMRFIVVLALALPATFARAADSYLYWMVNDATCDDSPVNFEYATISADGGSSYLALYSPGASSSETIYLLSDGENSSYGAPAGVYAGFNGEVGSFLVELWNESDERVGYSDCSYADLASYIYNSTTGSGSTSPMVVSQVVPEPTSGLLTLLGLAGLALRRKRRA